MIRVHTQRCPDCETQIPAAAHVYSHCLAPIEESDQNDVRNEEER